MELRVTSVIDLEELADCLSMELDEDALVRFVVAIDEARCDYEFSEALYKYFKKEHKFYKAEQELCTSSAL
jgi:hypothetical protein